MGTHSTGFSHTLLFSSRRIPSYPRVKLGLVRDLEALRSLLTVIISHVTTLSMQKSYIAHIKAQACECCVGPSSVSG